MLGNLLGNSFSLKSSMAAPDPAVAAAEMAKIRTMRFASDGDLFRLSG